MNIEMTSHSRPPRRRGRARIRRMSWIAALGTLLLAPLDLAAQSKGSPSSKSSSSKSSVSGSSGSRSSGSSARSAPSRSSSGSRSSYSGSKGGSSSKGGGSSKARGGATSRSGSYSKHKGSSSKPKRGTTTTRPKSGSGMSSYTDGASRVRKGKPSVRSNSKNPPPPVTSSPNRRLMIESVDAKRQFVDASGKTAGGGSGYGGYSGHGGHHGGHHYYYPYYYRHYYPHHYYPYYFYGPFGYHYYPYGHGYGARTQGSYRGDGLGALDLNVKPKKAEVYIDGNPIGPVGRYDGYPGYLWLEPGSYSLTFYLEGYQTLTRRYTVQAEVITAIDELLPPGEATPPPEPAPLPPPPDSFTLREGGGERDEAPGGPTDIGRIKLSIQPGDTAIYLDGHFLGTADELAQLSAGLIVEPGDHVLELVRPGYVTEEVPLSVPGGESLEIDLELRRR